jgi:hypothetical protein
VPTATKNAAGMLYAVGNTLGAAGAGLAIGSLGWLFFWLAGASSNPGSSTVLTVVALAALVCGSRDLGLIPFQMPQWACQVPRYWLAALGPKLTALLWGLMIGAGIRTQYRYAIVYVLALWILLAGDPVWGALVLGAYGATHGFAVGVAIALQSYGEARRITEALAARTTAFYTVSGWFLVAATPILASLTLA